jgi:large subunit ribosomal protein L4
MIEATHYAASGAKQGAFPLPADPFDGTVNEPVLHTAVRSFLANQRQGTHATKTRRYVTGGNQKPWRQKGTGRARQGSTRAPHWPGGGTVFGPHPRDYRMDLPKKVRQLARRSALNARAREGLLSVIDRVTLEAPKTAQAAGLLEALGLAGRKVLILTDGINRNLYLSCRNLPGVQVMPFADVAAYHLLWADAVLVEGGAVGASPAEGAPAPEAPARRAAKPRKAAAPKAAKPARAAATKAKAAPKKAKASGTARKPRGRKETE